MSLTNGSTQFKLVVVLIVNGLWVIIADIPLLKKEQLAFSIFNECLPIEIKLLGMKLSLSRFGVC